MGIDLPRYRDVPLKAFNFREPIDSSSALMERRYEFYVQVKGWRIILRSPHRTCLDQASRILTRDTSRICAARYRPQALEIKNVSVAFRQSIVALLPCRKSAGDTNLGYLGFGQPLYPEVDMMRLAPSLLFLPEATATTSSFEEALFDTLRTVTPWTQRSLLRKRKNRFANRLEVLHAELVQLRLEFDLWEKVNRPRLDAERKLEDDRLTTGAQNNRWSVRDFFFLCGPGRYLTWLREQNPNAEELRRTSEECSRLKRKLTAIVRLISANEKWLIKVIDLLTTQMRLWLGRSKDRRNEQLRLFFPNFPRLLHRTLPANLPTESLTVAPIGLLMRDRVPA